MAVGSVSLHYSFLGDQPDCTYLTEGSQDPSSWMGRLQRWQKGSSWPVSSQSKSHHFGLKRQHYCAMSVKTHLYRQSRPREDHLFSFINRKRPLGWQRRCWRMLP